MATESLLDIENCFLVKFDLCLLDIYLDVWLLGSTLNVPGTQLMLHMPPSWMKMWARWPWESLLIS